MTRTKELKLRKLVTNNRGHASPGLVPESEEVSVTATIVEFLSHFVGCTDVCLEKRREDSGVTGAAYLSSGINKVKMWGRLSRFLLVDCCGWVVFLGSVCVEICWRCAHWVRRVG